MIQGPWPVRRLAKLIGLVGLVVSIGSAIWLAVRPAIFRVAVVVVPVGGQRSSVSLPSGVASLVGANLRMGSSGFEPTQDVVSYLFRSRSVLLAAASVPYGESTLGEAATDEPVEPRNEEDLLRKLRRILRVTQSGETGFVTLEAEERDSAMVRRLVTEVLQEASRVFTTVAKAQAADLLLAQERRLDSANAELRLRETRLIGFDERNRIIPERSQLRLVRDRLERELSEAIQVQQLVQADRQGAIARQLEQAPVIAMVEGIPDVLAPRARRILFRSVLIGLAVVAAGGMVMVMAALVRDIRT